MPRKLAVATALFACLGVCVLVVLGRSASPTSADPQLDSEEQAFVTLINNYRAQYSLGPLSIDWEMQASSDWMSADMGINGYFDHYDHCVGDCVNGHQYDVSQSRDPWTRMCAFGYCYNTYKAENIAAGFTTAQSVFTAWQNSPGHNANMLGANYTAMGISRVYAAGSIYGWYWTNDFGAINSNATPPGSATPTTSPTLTPSPTASPTNPPSPTPTPSASPTPTPTPSPTPSPTHTPSPTPSPTPTPTFTASPPPAPTLPPPPAPTNTPAQTPDGPTPTPSPDGDATSTATATPPVTGAPVKGDTDCNGRLNAQDIIRLLEAVGQVQFSALSGCTPDLDVNCDGRIEAMDALAILLTVAGEPAQPSNACDSPSV